MTSEFVDETFLGQCRLTCKKLKKQQTCNYKNH